MSSDPTTVLGGTQVPLDLAYILDLVANNRLSARGQDLDYAATSRGQDITQAGDVLASRTARRGQDISFSQTLLDYAGKREAIASQYASDMAQIGESAAGRLLAGRVEAANVELAQKAFGLDIGKAKLLVDELNFRQRESEVQNKQNIMGMVADRSGPQDFVAYNSLLGQLAPPSPQDSATFDPFSILEGLNKPTSLQVPGYVETPFGITPQSIANAGAAAGGTGQQAPRFDPSNLVAQAMQGASGGISEPAIGAAQSFGSGEQFLSGPSFRSDAAGNPLPVAGPAPAPVAPAPAPAPKTWADLKAAYEGGTGGGIDMATGQYIPPKAEQGGIFNRSVITGDSRSGRENREAVMDLRPGPSLLAVVPVDKSGQPRKKKKKGSATGKTARLGKRRVPAAETGGVYGGGSNDVTYNRYKPEDIGSLPFLQKAFGKTAAPAFQGFGAQLSNPAIGVRDAPSLLNLQRYRDLAPSERDMTGSVYNQGLQVDYRDILERSRRAAPFGQAFGPSFYG